MSSYEMQSIEIDGMQGEACVRRVTQALASVPGLRVHRVQVGRAEVLGEAAAHPKLREAIEKAGYTLKGGDAGS